MGEMIDDEQVVKKIFPKAKCEESRLEHQHGVFFIWDETGRLLGEGLDSEEAAWADARKELGL